MASTITTLGLSCACGVCSKPFTDPRLLPCLHVFCKSCLESQNEGTFTCPTCYETSPHPPAQLPRHLRMERESVLLRIQEGGETICGSCDETKKTEAYCEDCGSSGICSTCVGMHKQLKVFKSHKVVPSHSPQPHSISVQLVSCSVHPREVVKYYCVSCNSLACSDCILDHKEHNCRRLDEVGEEERAELKSVLPEVEKAIPPIDEAIGKISDIVKRTRANVKKITKEVEEAFKQITAAAEKRKLGLLQEVESSVSAKTTQLEMQKEELEKIRVGLQLALDSGSVACREYSTAEVLAVKPSIHQASLHFLKKSHSADLHPVDNGSLGVSADTSKVMEMVSTLGSVQMGSPHPPLCSLVGINPKLPIGAAKSCEVVVTLQARDSKGEDIAEGGAEVRGRVINPSLGKEVSECVVNDLGDGKYEVRFGNTMEGQFQLRITVDDVSISDSPFTINVRDYTAIKSPMASLETSGKPTFAFGHNNMHYVSMEGGSIEVSKNGEKVDEIPQSKLRCSLLRGMAVDEQNGVMFVTSGGTHQVIKATLDGEVIASVGKKGSGELEFNLPFGLCLTEGGLLLVAGNNNKRVQVLGSDLSFVRFIPCESYVYGVSVDSTGNVHAVTEHKVEVLSINGDKIMEYGEENLGSARHVAFLNSQRGYSFVTDHVKNGKVLVFDWPENTLVHSFSVGKFPLGVRVDQEGKILVCCWGDQKLLTF